jgi:hypothetical protein
MIPAVIYVGLLLTPQALKQSVVSLVLVHLLGGCLAVDLPEQLGPPLDLVVLAQEVKPLNECVISCEGPEVEIRIRRLKAEYFQGLFS